MQHFIQLRLRQVGVQQRTPCAHIRDKNTRDTKRQDGRNTRRDAPMPEEPLLAFSSGVFCRRTSSGSSSLRSATTPDPGMSMSATRIALFRSCSPQQAHIITVKPSTCAHRPCREKLGFAHLEIARGAGNGTARARCEGDGIDAAGGVAPDFCPGVSRVGRESAGGISEGRGRRRPGPVVL